MSSASDPTSQAGVSTRLVHAGEESGAHAGAVVLPVFRSAMYDESEEVDDHVVYIRYHNTPNHRAVAAKLAALEGAEDAVVLGSGMAAISSSVLSVLRTGDHLLAQSTLYGGTHAFFTEDLPALGIEVEFVDADDVDGWEALRRPQTRAIYVEAIGNPLLGVVDLPGLRDWARAHGLTSMIDATVATPIGLQPRARGFDLSIHSATKFLNGHSDIVAGAVIGTRERCRAVLRKARPPGRKSRPGRLRAVVAGNEDAGVASRAPVRVGRADRGDARRARGGRTRPCTLDCLRIRRTRARPNSWRSAAGW